MKRIILFCFVLAAFAAADAQPSDATIRKDLTNPQTLEIRFTKSTGTRQWNSSTGNWEYVRGVQVRMKSKDYPGLIVKVVGDAVYQYTGASRYSYWKFRTGYNEWEGIPNPTEDEIHKMLAADWKQFYGYTFNRIVKLHSGPALDKERNFNWSNPKTVLFYMKINADMIASNVHLENVDHVFEVRLYRDDIKGPWLRFLSTSGAANSTIISKQELGTEKIKELQQKTLAYTLAEEAARKEMAALPDLNVPEFSSARDLADFFNELLRNGNPGLLKMAMLKTAAPHLLTEGSNARFSPRGQEMYDRAVKEAFGGDMKYKDQYCKNYTTTSLTSKSYIYIKGCLDKAVTMIGTTIVNEGYMEGVPQQKLKLIQLDVSVRQDRDAVSFINSFSNKSKLCPGD